MARVQLVMSDEDRDRFFFQAKREGMTLSAWMRAAARQRIKDQKAARFESASELRAFFEYCDTLDGPDQEPDWEQHLAVINESRLGGLPLK